MSYTKRSSRLSRPTYPHCTQMTSYPEFQHILCCFFLSAFVSVHVAHGGISAQYRCPGLFAQFGYLMCDALAAGIETETETFSP